MEVFDNFPPEVREILRDAPYNCDIICTDPKNLPSVEEVKEVFKLQGREIMLAAYGPDHPSLAV